MNNNSFNTCSRCGSANSLSAKYCYQCGARLKVPDEPKACPKCGTINSGLSNYCRACGSVLQGSTQTKNCPKCHKELPVTQPVCDCGYSFVAPTNTKRGKVRAEAGRGNEQVASAVAVVNETATAGSSAKRKGGRGIALVSIIFILAFAYLMFAPQNMRIGALANVLSLYAVGGEVVANNFTEIIISVYNNIKALPTDIHSLMVLGMVGIMALTIVLQFIIALARLIVGNRPSSTKSNIFYLILFFLTGIVAALLYCSTMVGFLKPLAPQSGSMGYLIFLVPAYYLIFWIISLFTKAKKSK